MEVTYKRELTHNYLSIDATFGDIGSYEARMLMDNNIEGLLKFRIKLIDTKCYFYYEITSKQPLSRILENRYITIEEIRKIIVNLALILERMEVYLLSEKQILLEPDYMYLEPETFALYLCMIPGKNMKFSDSVTGLLQYILGKVDHQDKECVVLAYGLYQESLKENYGMEDLLKLVQINRKIEPGICEEHLNFQPEPEKEWSEPAKVEKKTEAIEGKQTRAKNKWILLPIAGLLIGAMWLLFGKEGLYNGVPIILILTGGYLFVTSVTEKKDNIEQQETEIHINFEADEEPLEKRVLSDEWEQDYTESENTVLLMDLDANPNQKKLICLSEPGLEIVITDYPFVIGKQQELADYVLNKEGISRLHFKISREKGLYYVMDLNSTNGTYLNNNLINTNDMLPIHSGDIIRAANVEFQFN